MSLFLSKEDQLSTESIISTRLWFTPKEKWLDIITALYLVHSTEYYLFNKIKIWEESV